MRREQVLTVPCPKCGAQTGEPCIGMMSLGRSGLPLIFSDITQSRQRGAVKQAAASRLIFTSLAPPKVTELRLE
jgi:hypothetical protein